MDFEITHPADIEAKSMEIIAGQLEGRTFDPENQAVIKRVIHTTADFDYADTLYFSSGAVRAGLEALAEGADIVCDTNMAAAGINRAALGMLGGQLHCFMADEDVAVAAKERGVTRASISMEKAARLPRPLIVAVGNAPTALIALHQLMKEKKIAPKLVIAVPVGFVNVVESKELFVDCGIPAIVNRGQKGGSPVAAAICNAMIYKIIGKKN